MARRNCIVTDGGTYFDRNKKEVYTNDGYLVADLHFMDIDKMSDDNLTAITVALEFAYRQGCGVAQQKFAKKIQEIFEI